MPLAISWFCVAIGVVGFFAAARAVSGPPNEVWDEYYAALGELDDAENSGDKQRLARAQAAYRRQLEKIARQR